MTTKLDTSREETHSVPFKNMDKAGTIDTSEEVMIEEENSRRYYFYMG